MGIKIIGNDNKVIDESQDNGSPLDIEIFGGNNRVVRKHPFLTKFHFVSNSLNKKTREASGIQNLSEVPDQNPSILEQAEPDTSKNTPKNPASHFIPGDMKQLQDILKKIIADNGIDILNDHQKVKAYLDDYTGDEYRDEIKFLSRLLEYNIHMKILKTKEFDAQAQSEYVRQTAKKYFVTKDKTGEAVIELLFTVFYDCDFIKRRNDDAKDADKEADENEIEGEPDRANNNPSLSFSALTISYIIGSVIVCVIIGVIFCVLIGISGAFLDSINGDNSIDIIGLIILTKFDGIISHIKTSLAAYIIGIITVGSTIGCLFVSRTKKKDDNTE